VVFTDQRYAAEVRAAGGDFVDLFAAASVESVDGRSRPIPCRYVSFAGHRGEAVAQEAAAFTPSLVVYDTFAPVGRVVASELGLPYVNVCGGHDVDPARHLPALARDPRVVVAEPCLRAVERLRDRHGWADASPFSYVTALSPFLNIYAEPPAFLPQEKRDVFEPIAFFGSLPDVEQRGPKHGSRTFRGGDDTFKIYASFGTVVWRYYASQALAALRALRARVAGRKRRELVVSLGGAPVAPDVRAELEAPNVRVLSFVDQWALLEQADAFVTHHGLRSTHEAVYQRCPMLSYPFFWDQPQLAERCAALGLAVPLAEAPRAPISAAETERAFERIEGDRDAWRERLERARRWELETLAQRGRVIDRLLAPCGP
jgi:UDP:flavonoid glycosyltransferase YjiC (YdhE family)